MILDHGFELTLRPMKYPQFFDLYKQAIKNTWTVEEVDFSLDVVDLRSKMTPAENHLIKRLVAFWATGDSIVSNNLVLNLYKHVNSPEARMYLSRQLYEEAQHVEFYLTLLDTYLPDPQERNEAFAAVHNIPSVKAKADFAMKWIDALNDLDELHTDDDKRAFLLTYAAFAAAIEGMFFFASFAYVYFLRSKGLLQGLATGTNWVFRDESMHMEAAFGVIDIARSEQPDLLDATFESQFRAMLAEAIEVEMVFAADMLSGGVAGMGLSSMRQYLEYVADARLVRLGYAPAYNVDNPFDFMNLQDVQELANFFERRVSAYQVGVTGDVAFDDDF